MFPALWYAIAATPTAHNPQYGVMSWFLNTNRVLGALVPQ